MRQNTALLERVDAMAAEMRERILSTEDRLHITGTTYYVANDGNDENDGKSEATAWASLARVERAPLLPGDGVRFCRGDLFRGSFTAREGVGYGAYGTGRKPRLYAGERDLADPALWEIYDEGAHIWRLTVPILDCGTLLFNEGEAVGYKHIPSYLGGRFVVRDEERPFVIAEELGRDLDLYWHFDGRMTTVPSRGEDFPIPDVNGALGTLYLRSDRGNPGEVFTSIEALTRTHLIRVGDRNNVHIDNLCLRYAGMHGIAAGGVRVRGLHVTGCEIGWIGGCIQTYNGLDPNYPEGGRGTVTRFGNAIEIYGGCDDYLVEDCYIYECYDAGITHQVTTHGALREMTGIVYRNNLVERCVYSIEYFLDMTEGDTESYMEDVLMEGNILRLAGEGWGQQRHNKHTPAHIKGWSYTNVARGYRIRGNVFDRSAYRLLHLVAAKGESCPRMDGNLYLQYDGGMLGQYGGREEGEPPILFTDGSLGVKVREILGDEGAEVAVL